MPREPVSRACRRSSSPPRASLRRAIPSSAARRASQPSASEPATLPAIRRQDQIRLRVPPCCVRATSDPPHLRATLPGFLGRSRPCSPSPMRPNCTPRTKENHHAPPGLLLVPMLTERNQPARKHGLAFVEQPDSSRSCPDADVQRQLPTPPSSPKVSLSVFFSWAAAPDHHTEQGRDSSKTGAAP